MRVDRRGWRFFATRLNGDGTETFIHPELPIEVDGIEDILSGSPSMSASCEPVLTTMRGPDGKPILVEWSTAIYAEKDGEIRWGGIYIDGTFEGPRWTMDIASFTNYAREMPYTGDGYMGVEVDPLDVVRVIWNHIQSQKGGNIGLTLGSQHTDVTIGTELTQVEFDPGGVGSGGPPVSFEAGPYKLNWYTNHDLGGDIDKLAEETPFDYHETHRWRDDDTIEHRLDFYYPKKGRRRDDLRFVYGVNIFEAPSVKRSGDLYASGTLVMGAGTGPSMIKSIKEPPTRPDGRLRRIAVVVDDTIKSKKSADKRADIENQWRARLDDMTSVNVIDHPNAPVGAVEVGDEIMIEGQGDWIDISMWVRVLSITIDPTQGNVAQYDIVRTDKLTS